MAIIRTNSRGEFLLSRVDIRVTRDDIIDYIRMRLTNDPSRTFPEGLDALLKQYMRDVIYYGKEYIRIYRSVSKRVEEDYKIQSVKMAKRYFSNAKIEGK